MHRPKADTNLVLGTRHISRSPKRHSRYRLAKARLPSQPERAPRYREKASREWRAVTSENAPAYQRHACPPTRDQVHAEQCLTRRSAVAEKKKATRARNIRPRMVVRRRRAPDWVSERGAPAATTPLVSVRDITPGQRLSPGKDSRMLLSRETPSELWPRPGPGNKASVARVCVRQRGRRGILEDKE